MQSRALLALFEENERPRRLESETREACEGTRHPKKSNLHIFPQVCSFILSAAEISVHLSVIVHSLGMSVQKSSIWLPRKAYCEHFHTRQPYRCASGSVYPPMTLMVSTLCIIKLYLYAINNAAKDRTAFCWQCGHAP